jgi:lysophospholipid acyltransferase (LPLAT)-like uncharacterized protein
MMKGIPPHRLSAGHRLFVRIAVPVFRLWFATCRIQIVGRHCHDDYVNGEASGVGATWHRNSLFLVWFYRHVRPMILFSRSRDGELIARFAERLGIIPIRGSSSRGGKEAFREMLRYLAEPGARKVATVLDGPKGPKYVAKMGMILLAQKSGLPIMPIMMSAKPAIIFRKTWDQTMIPLPFSRVVVIYREPWRLPRRVAKDQLEDFRLSMERTLNEMRVEADQLAGYEADPGMDGG